MILNNSSLIIEDTEIRLKSVFHSEPFTSRSGKINISDSSINISSSSGIKAFQLHDSYSKIINSSFNINSDETVYTEAYNSIIKNSNLRLRIESGGFSEFYITEKAGYELINHSFQILQTLKNQFYQFNKYRIRKYQIPVLI